MTVLYFEMYINFLYKIMYFQNTENESKTVVSFLKVWIEHIKH